MPILQICHLIQIGQKVNSLVEIVAKKNWFKIYKIQFIIITFISLCPLELCTLLGEKYLLRQDLSSGNVNGQLEERQKTLLLYDDFKSNRHKINLCLFQFSLGDRIYCQIKMIENEKNNKNTRDIYKG